MDSKVPQVNVLPFPTPATPNAAPMRGVGWVFKWAAALAVLGWATAVLWTFACQLRAEQNLARAATAGLSEACCDRATSRSVEQVVRRRLSEDDSWADDVAVTIGRNGVLQSGMIHHAAGDQITVSLSVPGDSVLPAWSRRLSLFGQSTPIVVSANR